MTFNPNQPRDEQGRWTSNGASSSVLDEETKDALWTATKIIAPIALQLGGAYALGAAMGQYKAARGAVNALRRQFPNSEIKTSAVYKIVEGIETTWKTGKWSTKAPKAAKTASNQATKSTRPFPASKPKGYLGK